jgi:hypothetical protein
LSRNSTVPAVSCVSAAAAEASAGAHARGAAGDDHAAAIRPRARRSGDAGGVEPGPANWEGGPWGRPARNPRIPRGATPGWGAAAARRRPLRFGKGKAVRRRAAAGGACRGGGGRGFGGGRGRWKGDLGEIVGAERRGEGERGEVEASTNRGSARIRAWRVAAGGPGLRRL